MDSQKRFHKDLVRFTKVDAGSFNPFPGLRPFGIEESHLFFGREGQSDEILLKLARNRFVATLGFSGSGKSSLIYCGLIPTLHGGFMTQAGSDWRIVVMRPGSNPIDNLAEALTVQEKDYETLKKEERIVRKAVLATILRSSSQGLIEAVKHAKTGSDENVLILVDQFEEIFRYKKSETKHAGSDESALFISLLLEAVRQQQGNVYVTLTMRSDFIGECSSFPELTDMINRSHYLIPQMNREQKRSAIVGPVLVGGGKIAPRLVQQLLNDIGESPDQLPVLQHALMRTWQYWTEYKKPDEPIDLHHYQAIGTVREALSQHANEAYDLLNRRQQEICEVMFKAITEKGAENQGIRRPTKLGVIAAIAGVSEDDVLRVVERFREPGRSLLMPPYGTEINPDTVIDISHESLMRVWNRLKTWLEEEAKAVDMYMKLAETAERHQRGVTGLLQMPDLQISLNWQSENKPTLVWGRRYHPAFERTILYLENSQRAYDTEQRNRERIRRRAVQRTRIAAVGLAFVAVGCVFLAYLSKTKADEASLKELEAEARRKEAVLAKEEADDAKDEAERSAAIAELEKQRAEQQAIIADQQRQEAELAKKAAQASEKKAAEQSKIAQQEAQRATQQAKIAEERRQEAVAAQQEADKLRYQAIAQSMSSRVEDIRDNQQKTLIALQSFNFYKKYGDKPYNGDVYDGVYNAYTSLEGNYVNAFKGHGGGVRAVVIARDGTTYTAGADGKVYAWKIGQKEAEPTPILDVSEDDVVIRTLRLVENRHLLLVSGETPTIYAVDLKNTSKVRHLSSSMPVVYDMVVLPKDESYAAVGSSGVLVRGSIASGVNKVVDTNEVRVKKLTVSPSNQWLAGGDEKGNILLWNVVDGQKKVLYTMPAQKPVHAITFSHDNKYLAFGDETGKLVLWDMERQAAYTELDAHYSRITHISFNEEDRLLVTSSWDKTAKIWDMKYINDLPIVLKNHQSWVHMADFDSKGKYVITVSQDNYARFWPTLAEDMISSFCEGANRNLSKKEWAQYIGAEIPYELTCENYPEGE